MLGFELGAGFLFVGGNVDVTQESKKLMEVRGRPGFGISWDLNGAAWYIA